MAETLDQVLRGAEVASVEFVRDSRVGPEAVCITGHSTFFWVW